jgi:hypothetical protein
MSYGVQMFDAGGNTRLDTDETFTRLIHIEKLPSTFNSTFDVPEFDDTRGLFYVVYFMHKLRSGAGGIFTRQADSYTPMRVNLDRLGWNSNSLPGLFWDNTLKRMTVTAASLPAGFSTGTDIAIADYAIIFLHYG